MVNTRLHVAYDGSAFNGWAFQPGARTVEGEMARAIDALHETRGDIVVAGRTDAGVHATGQVVSVTGGLARTLELDRYAVREPQPQFEFGTAPEPPAVERADSPHGKAKRRRRDA